MLHHADTDRMHPSIRLVHSEDPATTRRREAWEARRKAAKEQAEADRARSDRRAKWFVAAVAAVCITSVLMVPVFYW